MKLGYVMLMVAVGAMLVFAPVAMAAKGGDKGKGHEKGGLFGKVTAVDTTAKTVTIEVKSKEPGAVAKTVTTDANTKFVKGEKGAEDATFADATEGSHVIVTLDGDKVAKVVIMPARAKKK